MQNEIWTVIVPDMAAVQWNEVLWRSTVTTVLFVSWNKYISQMILLETWVCAAFHIRQNKYIQKHQIKYADSQNVKGIMCVHVLFSDVSSHSLTCD